MGQRASCTFFNINGIKLPSEENVQWRFIDFKNIIKIKLNVEVFLKVEVLVKMKVHIFLNYGLFNIFKVMFMENMNAW